MSTSPLDKDCRYGIGIDTGGTCTDTVVADLATGAVVAKSKALTTPDNLSTGIRNALQRLEPELLTASGFVALSTTLATNSIVEGKGARVGLIMAVPNPHTFELPTDLPCEHIAVISGGHNNRGEMITALDSTVAARIDELAPLVDAFAISSYFSIYNNEHENALRHMVISRTAKPVVCTHELSGAVGMVERATTAVLNARLLPVIDELVEAVEQILTDMGLTLPLMIVKGDGSMMTAEAGRTRPVETVLSGPAASIAGGCRLSGIENGIVVDMGGTTTDIALVHEGRASVSRQGAKVGGWRTRVQAVDMWTLGVGGDSQIRCQPDGAVKIGPRRVVPYSLAATLYKEMPPLLRKALETPSQNRQSEDLTFYTLRKHPTGQLTDTVSRLVDNLDRRVMSQTQINMTVSPYLDLDSLISQGFVIEVGFTPTDLLHTTGESSLWDAAAADAGLKLLTARWGRERSTTELQERLRRELDILLAGAIAAKNLLEDPDIEKIWGEQYHHLLERLFRLESRTISARFPVKVPLIAVGAPAYAHLPSAATLLSAKAVIPPHAEVANAYGAVTGKVVASASAVIKPVTPDGYIIICGTHREKVVNLQEGIKKADTMCSNEAKQLALARGAREITVTLHREEVVAPLEEGWGDPVLLEVRFTATASGSPPRRSDLSPSEATPRAEPARLTSVPM